MDHVYVEKDGKRVQLPDCMVELWKKRNKAIEATLDYVTRVLKSKTPMPEEIQVVMTAIPCIPRMVSFLTDQPFPGEYEDI